jgi:hypothetical protein
MSQELIWQGDEVCLCSSQGERDIPCHNHTQQIRLYHHEVQFSYGMQCYIYAYSRLLFLSRMKGGVLSGTTCTEYT